MINIIRLRGQLGFTLIEVIITLVIFSIAGAMLVSVAGSNLSKSVVPVTTLDNLLLLQEEMEVVNAEYYSALIKVNGMGQFKTFLDAYSSSNFSVTYSNFNDGSGSGSNSDILKVVLTSTALGANLTTLMPDITN